MALRDSPDPPGPSCILLCTLVASTMSSRRAYDLTARPTNSSELPAAVAVGGVPERDAELDRLPEERLRRVLVQGPLVEAWVAVAHAAQSDPAHLEPGMSKSDVIHDRGSFRRRWRPRQVDRVLATGVGVRTGVGSGSEHLFGDRDCRHRSRPAGVEGEVNDHLFEFGHAPDSTAVSFGRVGMPCQDIEVGSAVTAVKPGQFVVGVVLRLR